MKTSPCLLRVFAGCVLVGVTLQGAESDAQLRLRVNQAAEKLLLQPNYTLRIEGTQVSEESASGVRAESRISEERQVEPNGFIISTFVQETLRSSIRGGEQPSLTTNTSTTISRGKVTVRKLGSEWRLDWTVKPPEMIAKAAEFRRAFILGPFNPWITQTHSFSEANGVIEAFPKAPPREKDTGMKFLGGPLPKLMVENGSTLLWIDKSMPTKGETSRYEKRKFNSQEFIDRGESSFVFTNIGTTKIVVPPEALKFFR